METIGVADLEKYWITFERLLLRWNIKEDLLASYCVCVDTSKGSPPLMPHFYQGEFPIPGGGTWKRLAKYEPEYKNAADYLNKSKTESQLVQEFLESIANIKKDTIWFLLSDIEELEAADYSLRLAAKASATNNITTKLDYITLDAPITFEEILPLWIGKDKYDEIKSYDPHTYYPLGTGPDFDDYLSTIRSVENQLDSALRNGYLHLYHQRIAAGREFYYEVPYNQGELFAGTREGYGDKLNKCFQFMRHRPDLVGAESDPLYFDGNEVFQKFPFLKPPPLPLMPVAPPHTGSKKDVARIQATRQACEKVRAGIGQGQHGFQVRGEYKTNSSYFRQSVQVILDVKPHNDTVREEWGKVPGGIKHSGRVPEQ
jgi:hypothetical protein